MSTIQRELNRFTYEDESRGIRIRIKQLYSRHFEASAHATSAQRLPMGNGTTYSKPEPLLPPMLPERG